MMLLDDENIGEYFQLKFKYHAELEEKYNTTGLSIMQLNESLEGSKIAKKINRLIAADMAERFGEQDNFEVGWLLPPYHEAIQLLTERY